MNKKQTIIYFCIIAVVFGACKQEETSPLNIQGDWYSPSYERNFGEINYPFSFEDSLCTILSPWGRMTPYSIKEDSLFIKKPRRIGRASKKTKERIEYVFLVDKINSKELHLIPITEETKAIFKDIKSVIDTLKLTKTNVHQSVPFERIAFCSSLCFGACPSMFLEIDKDGTLYFEGKAHVDSLGYYKGALSKYELGLLQEKINALNWDTLEERYMASHTDGQSLGIEIKFDNRIVRHMIYGMADHPVELSFLFHKLTNVYTKANLVADTTVALGFQSRDLMNFVIPLPPPPPINNN